MQLRISLHDVCMFVYNNAMIRVVYLIVTVGMYVTSLDSDYCFGSLLREVQNKCISDVFFCNSIIYKLIVQSK